MPDDMKGGLLIVPDAHKSKPDISKEPEEDGFDAAAKEAFDAQTTGDFEGFKLALKAAVMACMDEDYSEG